MAAPSLRTRKRLTARPRPAQSAQGADRAGVARLGWGPLRSAYAQLPMAPQAYVLRCLLPMAAAGLASCAVVAFLLAPRAPAAFRGLLVVAPALLFVVAAALLPLVLRERRRSRMDAAMHFYITRAGVLATANLGVLDILRRLTDRQAFGPLAEETERIVFLVTRWNMSLSDAARAVAKGSPSAIFAEFLERLAYAMDSGEELAHFLDSEQRVVMEDFATVYQGALYSLEALKDAFLSIAMATVFLVVFGIVSPILTGFRAEDFMGYAAVLLSLIDAVFLMLMLGRAPRDPVWHPRTGETPRDRVLRRALPPAALAGLVLGPVLLLTKAVPANVALVAAMTPGLAAGLWLRKEEGALRRRDENYPAFVRALGSATSASGGVARQVLRRLRHHNFGPLSEPLERLYRRLHLRVDDRAAWRAFAAETGSNLVANYNAMFVEGTRAGGEPEHIGRIISANYTRIINLRKHRRQVAGSFRSMHLGFMAGMGFTLQIGVGVLQVLSHLFAGTGAAAAGTVMPLSTGHPPDFALLALLVQFLLLVHALLGSMMAQAVDGGSFLTGYVDFVLMMWIAVGTGFASSALFSTFFPT